MSLFWEVIICNVIAIGFLPGSSGYTIRHNKQITHITPNNTTIKQNTAHKITHTISVILYKKVYM
jgi:hypothetical protein